MSDQLFAAVIGGVLALTGALLVFVFTVIYTEIREARQRARERKGLARLLLHEVERNEEQDVVHTGNPPTATGDEQEVVSVYGSNRPSLQAWVESRVRLAQLMGHEDFNTVAEYYSILQTLDEELGPSGNVTGKSSRPFVKPKQTWAERTEAVKASLRRLS